MLASLNISNIVLIEKLNLEFGNGLNILTGETGAGKSILLDALSLALGARSDIGLIRHGCDSAAVTATFDYIPQATKEILAMQDIDYDNDDLILRRTLNTDGKSKAWINDTPVSIKTLKQVGDTLVEIHGQFANHTLLNQSTHLTTLDAFAQKNIPEYESLLNAVRNSYDKFNGARKQMASLQELLSRSAAEREYLEHNVSELRALNPQIGEEEELANKRNAMMNAEKNSAILKDALQALSPHGNALDSVLFSVAHILERIKGDENPYQNQIDKLYDIADTVAQIAQSLENFDTETENMDAIEERLFAIRAAARKHRVSADELPQKLHDMASELDKIDNSDTQLQQISKELKAYQSEFEGNAKLLSVARHNASEILRDRLLVELPDLKLGSADFKTEIVNKDASSTGTDDITFMIKTNTGAPFAQLHRAASGGELARLMLAIRVVLAGNNDEHIFVFDEVDTGISGATASAVGARLNKLANANQALVITHSAQVAGYANQHYKISKSVIDDKTITNVHEITDDNRINEIARIISGAEITPESITMAKTLIKN
ncbi:MAG: DNA repair protein RecN [Alphaproteobacteria bacterium]|nr:DNA repair protein RecN [Alphaproteobacteria bacterium]